MVRLWTVVGFLSCLTDGLLLFGVRSLCGGEEPLWRIPAAALIGGAQAFFSLVPGFAFLGGKVWHLAGLAAMAVCAFGLHRRTVSCGVLLCLLTMALRGISDSRGFSARLPGAAVTAALCFIAATGTAGQRFVPVELRHGGKHLHIRALRDTGNTLRDPISGSAVLVAAPEVAQQLLGLTAGELRDPVAAMAGHCCPGLRLIPYRTVGQGSGLMLGLRCDAVTIGGRRAGRTVAFAPEPFSGAYQALTGG